MLYKKERLQLIEKIERIVRFGLLTLEGGGISIKLDDGNILATPTGSAFRQWQLNPRDLVVTNASGKIIERGNYYAMAEFPIDLHIFSNFPLAGAVFHLHGPYSLVFASLLKTVPVVTNQIEILGVVPCLQSANETGLKKEYLAHPYPVDMPEAVVQRPEVYVVFKRLIDEFDTHFINRKDELKSHGLAFTVEKHGLFTIAKNIDEVIENAARVEAAARTAIFAQRVAK